MNEAEIVIPQSKTSRKNDERIRWLVIILIIVIKIKHHMGNFEFIGFDVGLQPQKKICFIIQSGTYSVLPLFLN